MDAALHRRLADVLDLPEFGHSGSAYFKAILTLQAKLEGVFKRNETLTIERNDLAEQNESALDTIHSQTAEIA